MITSLNLQLTSDNIYKSTFGNYVTDACMLSKQNQSCWAWKKGMVWEVKISLAKKKAWPSKQAFKAWNSAGGIARRRLDRELKV